MGKREGGRGEGGDAAGKGKCSGRRNGGGGSDSRKLRGIESKWDIDKKAS